MTAIPGGEDPLDLFYRRVDALGELRSGQGSAGGRVGQEPGPGAAGLEVPERGVCSGEDDVCPGTLKGWGVGCGEPGPGTQGDSSPTLYASLAGPRPGQFPCVGQAGVGSVCREPVRPLPHILGLPRLTPSPSSSLAPYPSQGPPQSL